MTTLISMRDLKVGAFEAKTHLSQLLDEVEKGAVVRITRRGKPIAVLQQDETVAEQNALDALVRLRSAVSHKAPVSDVIKLRDEGRER